MLDIKKHRLDYGAMLIPPPGYRLAKAVAATYTLDLNTLLSIPVALFFSQTLEPVSTFGPKRETAILTIDAAPKTFGPKVQTRRSNAPSLVNNFFPASGRCRQLASAMASIHGHH